MVARVIARPAAVMTGFILLAGISFLLLTGVSPLTAVTVTFVVFLQGLSGSVLWQWIRRKSADIVEVIGVGLALGTAAAALAGVLSTMVIGTPLGWLIVPLVALGVWLRSRSASGGNSSTERITPVASAIIGVLLGALSLVPNVVNYPLRWAGQFSGYHGDMLFFESLGTSLSRLGPLESIFSPDVLIRYHWLAYAWAGQVTSASGAESFVALVRVLPFVSVIGSVLIAVAWARRLSSVRWVPILAVVLLTFGGYIGATYGTIFNFDSPSQSMTTLWLLAFAWMVSVWVKPEFFGASLTVPMLMMSGVLAFALAAGKVSAGVVAGGAVVWLAFIGWVRHAAWKRPALQMAVVTIVALVAGYMAVVFGSADPGGLNIGSLIDRASSIQGMNPIPGSVGIVLGTALLLLAIGGRWVGLLWLLGDRRQRWEPTAQLGVGFALAAIATVIALSGGMNDTWFALGASAPLAVISAAGVGEASRNFDARRSLAGVMFVVFAGAVFVVVFALWATGASGGNVWTGTLRWLGPLVGVIGAGAVGAALGAWLGRRPKAALAGSVLMVVLVAAPSRLVGVGTGQVGVQPGLGADAFSPIEVFAETVDRSLVGGWSDTQVEAAAWLRDETDSDALVATNVTLSPLVPALTQRQTYVSGIHYQAPYGTPGNLGVLLEREAHTWSAVSEPTDAHVDVLCTAGVEWLWIDPSRAGNDAWRELGVVGFEADDVVVMDLRPRCNP